MGYQTWYVKQIDYNYNLVRNTRELLSNIENIVVVCSTICEVTDEVIGKQTTSTARLW